MKKTTLVVKQPSNKRWLVVLFISTSGWLLIRLDPSLLFTQCFIRYYSHKRGTITFYALSMTKIGNRLVEHFQHHWRPSRHPAEAVDIFHLRWWSVKRSFNETAEARQNPHRTALVTRSSRLSESWGLSARAVDVYEISFPSLETTRIAAATSPTSSRWTCVPERQVALGKWWRNCEYSITK